MEVRHQLTGREEAEVRGLLDAARTADRHQPLAEHKRLDLAHRGMGRPGFCGFLLRAPDGRLEAYAQLAADDGASAVEAVVDPAARAGRGHEERTRALVAAAVDEVARRGGGALRYWVSAPAPVHETVTGRLGFVPDRTLLHMTVALPLPGTAPALPGGLELRPFRPGADDAAWLAANNRAFAGHPEQGGWTPDELADREGADWFDPAGFLVAEDADGRLAGSCWTKVHAGPEVPDGPHGEIYVIFVDPDWHGRGLGRALTVAGLAHLAGAGMRRGALYVDEANAAAVALYRSLGFAVDHVDRAFRREVPAAR